MKKIRGCVLLCLFLLGLFGLSFAQSDSLFRKLDKLGINDILLTDSLLSTQVSVASRSLQNISALPFTIYVIHRSEILSNGYITLADALKSMPGIRVSQPGSAVEGETFIMRGLLGNAYAKILVNGNPVKPYVVSGMPIGAQLPVQQAERIEVIYGPAAALYGADASAGVINIVLADSERPIFTKASLHVGSDNYKSINLLFGGKTGRGDNVIRFKMYGMDTRFDNRRIFYDKDSLYNPQNYFNPIITAEDTFNDLNFRGNNFQNTPHESRSVGLELQYRFLSISVANMNRRDHSAIGLNPTAVTYSNPLISTGEAISTVVAKSRFNINKIQAETKFEFLSYNLDNGSSNLYVNPVLNGLLYNTIQDSLNEDVFKSLIENNFFSNLRFVKASSNEYSIEQTFNMPVFSNGDLTLGLQYLNGNGSTLQDFQTNAFNFNMGNVTNLSPAFQDQDIEEYSLFIQLFKPIGKKINLLAGGQYLKRNNGDFAAPLNTFNPRLAILYKTSEQLQFRMSYSTAVRAPSPYFSAASYTYESDNYSSLITGKNQLAAERTKAYEFGLRWDITKQVDLDASISYTSTDGFINYNIDFEGFRNNRISEFTLGYFNDENSKAELVDIQAYLRFTNIIPSIKLGGTLGLNFADGKETLTTVNLTRFENEIRSLDDLRANPKVLSRLSLYAMPVENLLIRVDQLYASQSLSRNSFRLNTPVNAPDRISLYNSGYYTMDLSLNYTINKNFLLYLKGSNIFNTGYAGIDASSSTDVLIYNPQSLFTFRLGLNYELN